MGTVSIPFDVAAARPDITNTPELVYINGTNFPPDGYAFPQSSAKAIYLRFNALQYGGGDLTLSVHWYSRAGSTTGNVTWSAALAAIGPGDAVSVEAKAFATNQAVTNAVSSTAKGLTQSTITISNLDGLINGDSAWIKITRTDTSMTGDAVFVDADLSYSDGNSGTPGSGDFVGPASSTTNALVRFANTTGKLGKNSPVVCDDSGNLTGVGTINGGNPITAPTLSTGDYIEWTGSAFVARFSKHAELTAAFTGYSTTQTAITGLTITLPRAGTYVFEARIVSSHSSTTATIAHSINFTGTVTRITSLQIVPTNVTAIRVDAITANGTAGTAVTRAATTAMPVILQGELVCSTSGDLQVRGQTSAATYTAAIGSCFTVRQVA